MATVYTNCNSDRGIRKHTRAARIFPFQQVTLLGFEASLHCHTDKTEITYVSDIHLGITLITFDTVIQITLPGLQVSSCLLKPTKHERGSE